jgi:hypothetical protein
MRVENKRRRTAAESLVREWNRTHANGRAVTVQRDNGQTLKTVTRTKAFVDQNSKPVIFVKGIAGYYLLDRVIPYFGTQEPVGFIHASGECVCKACGNVYFMHPEDLEHLGTDNVPFLVRLCDGSLVKL